MKKMSLIACLLLILALLCVACTKGGDSTDTGNGQTDTESQAVVSDETEGTTDTADTEKQTEESEAPLESATGEPSGTVPEETDSEPESASEEPEETETDPLGMRLNSERLVQQFSGKNQVDVALVEDPQEGSVIKIFTVEGSAYNDPFVAFNYSNAQRITKTGVVNLDQNPYMILKVRCEGCTNATFELYWTCGAVPGFTGEAHATVSYDNTEEGWQYIVFDMSNNDKWSKTLTSLRFDYMVSAAGPGETMYIAAIWFAPSREELKHIIGDVANPFEVETDPAAESRIDELLSLPDPAGEADNTKLDAAHEDAGIDLWFNHSYTKTAAEDTTSTGWYTYTMRLAKNEIEDCHLLLAAADGRTGLTVSVSPFTNADGVTLTTDLMYAYYFEDVDGQTIPDPTPWVREGMTFDLPAGQSRIFIIKVHTAADSPAGMYQATVTVKDADGQEVKKAVVSAYVWNFALPEETSCKTQMDLSWWNIYVSHKCYEGDDGLLYKLYYDYLLENRICAYTLPYATDGTYEDSRILEYLNNPRVVAFNPLSWKKDADVWRVQAAYAYLSQNQDWLRRSYFYLVDEPGSQDALNKINSIAEVLKQYFPGYKMLAPEHVNYALNADSTEDYFSAVQNSINVWCFKPYFFTTYEEYRYSVYAYDKPLTYWMTPQLEKNLGTFADRMYAEQAGGDELWWYVTRNPESPEITLLMETQAVRYRILFWQQKLYNVDGFLYYSVNDWYEMGENQGLNSKHEVSDFPYDVYGNGVLVYCGAPFGEYGPVGCLRLECVRDGIEDYEYLTMLAEQYDKETVDLIIRRLTTSLSEYNTDEEFFTALRIAVGNLLEQAVND